ncbi:DsrE/DsrF/DrsH-like family protein [Pseudalkalibacillus caeni]|uniref:Sulfur reductase DrsE n=1 Tax=Exobacillus caeni TaxID=2574798 RepID=A0A5R9F7X8_9BACL|nr:DsrE/DsrF/DrsH-like family protein [Pseudalkalibacillus caeni]TLS35845.1 sulfur reductase DrsE [Pseudalkalibacillus caeni]
MGNKKFIYFVTLSSNVPFVLKDALERTSRNDKVMVFFDLDGARALDKRYLKKIDRTHGTDLSLLFKKAIESGIGLYGCQLNVLLADGMKLIEGVELAGVATFLDMAYDADAVLSY